MKVAIISDVQAERNGVGTYYADLMERLKEHVQRIELYTPSCCSSWVSLKMPWDTTQIITFPNIRALHARLDILDPEIVIIPTPGPWGFVGAHYARRRGLPLIVGFHTHFKGLSNLYWRGFRGYTSGLFLRLAHRWLFRRSEVVLVNAPQMVEEALALGARAIDVIGTPLAQGFIDRPPSPLGLTLTRVLFAGRLAPEKNLETVVEAALQLPQLHFMIAGDGPMRKRIEEAASRLSNLQFLGWMPRAELLELLDTVDLLVLPSHMESLGSIALEGLARGRNVLISANCGINEWPMLERALFLIQKDEPLGHAIRRLAEGDSRVRHDKARLGAEGAMQMSQHAIEGWLKTLNNCLVEAYE